MKKISYWARDHKRSARIIIVLSMFLLAVIGINTGILLSDLNSRIPIIILILSALVYSIAFIAYPSKKLKGTSLNYNAFYFRQKTCDFLLAFSTFWMFVFMGNRPDQLFQYKNLFGISLASNASILPGDSVLKSYKSIAEFSASMKDKDGKTLKWKERKKLLKEQVRAIKKSTESSNGEKVVLIIVSILLALLLLYIVATISCLIGCSGSGVLGVIIAVGGTGLVILLLIKMIKSSNSKKRKSKDVDIEK